MYPLSHHADHSPHYSYNQFSEHKQFDPFLSNVGKYWLLVYLSKLSGDVFVYAGK